MEYITYLDSPVGTLLLSSDGENLTGLWISGQKYYGATLQAETVKKDNLPIFVAAKSWLKRYFAGEKPKISELSLAPCGSPFRQRVWKLMCQIPYGEVTTYGEIARKIAAETGRQTMSAQAVGGAVGHNPITIIMPCHRVIGTGGNLTGYAGGIDIKEKLLKLENAAFDVKKKGE